MKNIARFCFYRIPKEQTGPNGTRFQKNWCNAENLNRTKPLLAWVYINSYEQLFSGDSWLPSAPSLERWKGTFIFYFSNREVSYVLRRNTKTKIYKCQIKEESKGCRQEKNHVGIIWLKEKDLLRNPPILGYVRNLNYLKRYFFIVYAGIAFF